MEGRNENKDDDAIWAVTCLVIRRVPRSVHLPLARKTIDFARARRPGTRGVSHDHPAGKEITWGELHAGAVRSSRRQVSCK